jgi:hypothetical protein
MSAIGPKRTFLFALYMSAFGGKADMQPVVRLIGNEVTLIDRATGSPLRDNQGRLYCKQLHDNDDPTREAKRLLKEYDAATSRKSDFNRPLVYPNPGIA